MARLGERLALGIVLVALLAGCGRGGSRGPEAARTAPHAAAPPPCRTEAAVRETPSRSFAVVVRRPAPVRSLPRGGRVLARVRRLDLNRFPTVLGVLGVRTGPACRPVAYRVQAPVTRNRRAGWIDARAVRLFAVGARIDVDLSARRLVAYRDGAPVLRARVAVGSPRTPTPVGRFFVNELWLLRDPRGPFGYAALGISAHSEVLHDWPQHGPIALHGTNEPGLIGRAVSNGCVRLANADVRRLLRLTPVGTPVTIHS
jgi:L,D-transpeptidase catalytic domain